MKNFRKIALGLLVGAMALGFSAFTRIPSPKFVQRARMADGRNPIADGFIVQLNTTNNFQENPAPDLTKCKNSALLQCVYDVTTTGAANIPDQPGGYSAGDISSYLGHGWIVADPMSSAALYKP